MKIHLTNENIHHLLSKLTNSLAPIRDKFDLVIGIRNGGINISTYIAYAFAKEHASIYISFYNDDGSRNTVPFTQGIDENNPLWMNADRPFLLVDDIVDNGNTVKWFADTTQLRQGKDFYVAVLYWCEENSVIKPDFYADKKNKNDWVIFPWEGE